MNILVLNGSPRYSGNTSAMVEAFAQGAKEKEHNITVVPVCQKKISGCLACEFFPQAVIMFIAVQFTNIKISF